MEQLRLPLDVFYVEINQSAGHVTRSKDDLRGKKESLSSTDAEIPRAIYEDMEDYLKFTVEQL